MDFLCNECAKTFAKEVDLVIHQARAHDKPSFSCEMCNVINVGYTNHNNHMRVHKPKKKTTRLLKCEKCYYETDQTLPKALRTQALTALTSNFGLVGLVQYAVW